MAANRLEIHPAALAELKSAVSWYMPRSKTAALKFIDEVDRAIDFIIESPETWPTGEHGTRKFVLQRFPFALIYRQKEPVIEILAIAHGHRRPGYWKARL